MKKVRTSSLDSTAEELLLERAQQGDDRAYEMLASAFRPRIHMWVKGLERKYLGGSPLRGDESEDIVQDVLIKFWKNIHQFKGNSKLSTWLFSITQNHFKNQIKKHAKHESNLSLRDFSTGDADEEGIVPLKTPVAIIDFEDPESEFEAKEQVEKVFEIIKTLPEALQEVFWLRERDGLSYQQIADTVNIRLDTVKTRLHRARKLIYAELHVWANEDAH